MRGWHFADGTAHRCVAPRCPFESATIIRGGDRCTLAQKVSTTQAMGAEEVQFKTPAEFENHSDY